MAHDQLELQVLLEGITEHVYFQPPSNVEIQYPCIIYERDASQAEFAGNRPYRHTWRYAVTVVDRDPESTMLDQVAALPMCSFSRHFAADDLNHDVFNLYF